LVGIFVGDFEVGTAVGGGVGVLAGIFVGRVGALVGIFVGIFVIGDGGVGSTSSSSNVTRKVYTPSCSVSWNSSITIPVDLISIIVE
jgi:hypothetical protein